VLGSRPTTVEARPQRISPSSQMRFQTGNGIVSTPKMYYCAKEMLYSHAHVQHRSNSMFKACFLYRVVSHSTIHIVGMDNQTITMVKHLLLLLNLNHSVSALILAQAPSPKHRCACWGFPCLVTIIPISTSKGNQINAALQILYSASGWLNSTPQ